MSLLLLLLTSEKAAAAAGSELLGKNISVCSVWEKKWGLRRKEEGRLTIGSPSTTPPTVWRRGDVIPPTIGRPFVVSSTVPRSLERDT